MTDREGGGNPLLPLAASLLLHAALLGLLALGLLRGLPEQEASLEVRLVSLEPEEGAGLGGGGAAVGAPAVAGRAQPRPGVVGRTGAPQAGEGQPAGVAREAARSAAASLGAPTGEPPLGPEVAPAAPPAAPTPRALLPAPLPPAPAPPAPTADPPAARELLAIEGPKVTTPDGAFSTPSGFDLARGGRVRQGDLAGAAAPGEGGTPPREEQLGRGRSGTPDGKGLAGEGGGGAAEIAGALSGSAEGGLGAGDATGGLGAGRGTASPGGGTGRHGVFAHILRRIEAAKRYPEEARRLGHRGTVAIRFRIAPDGAVAAAEVAASSGSSLLDAASLETVRRAAPLPQTPGWLLVRISYGLTESRP